MTSRLLSIVILIVVSISMAHAESPSIQASSDREASVRERAESFFQVFGVACRHQDQQTLAKLFSSEEMFEQVRRFREVRFESPSQERSFREGFDESFFKNLASYSMFFVVDDLDVLRVEAVGTGRWVVYVRFWDETFEVYQKTRWWFLERPDASLVAYDYEDLDLNLRTSVLVGAFLPSGASAELPWVDPLASLLGKLRNTDSEGLLGLLPDLEADLDRLLAVDLPTAIEPFARILQYTVFAMEEDFEAGLRELDRIEEIDPGIPMIHYGRGSAYLGLGQWDRAIEAYSRYAEVLGWDSDVHEMVADAFHGKGDLAQARRHATAGLADNPDAWGCLMTLAVSLPEEDWPEIRTRVQATSDAESAYDSILSYAIGQDAVDLARAVLGYLENDLPGSELVPYYETVLAPPSP